MIFEEVETLNIFKKLRIIWKDTEPQQNGIVGQPVRDRWKSSALSAVPWFNRLVGFYSIWKRLTIKGTKLTADSSSDLCLGWVFQINLVCDS